jgi:hypothetical protein
VIGECILERAVLVAGLAHEDAPSLFQYLRFCNSGIVSEIHDINLTFEDCLHCFTVALGT